MARAGAMGGRQDAVRGDGSRPGGRGDGSRPSGRGDGERPVREGAGLLRIHPGALTADVVATAAVLALTTAAAGLLVADLWRALAADVGDVGRTLDEVAFTAVALFMLYGNVVYQVCRLGSLRHHSRFPVATEDAVRRSGRVPGPRLTVLVPSYKEERRTIEQTLLSAALQRYRGLRVVLLLDDPPRPAHPADRQALEDARALVARLGLELGVRAERVRAAMERLPPTATTPCARATGEGSAWREATFRLVSLHLDTAGWLEQEAARWAGGDHTDRFFAEQVLRVAARELRAAAAGLGRGPGAQPSWPALHAAHEDLLALLDVELVSFERKRYENLSHEPNKAMNLNSYIALLGGRWSEVVRDGALHLERCGGGVADLHVPDADYVLTLDADSLLLPGYAARLVHHLEQPGNERVAVVQTPYRALPGATSTVERLAGATTDIQHIVHQGLARHGATFWVGANALLRRRALDDIAEVDVERGHRIVRYVQDRTVIEDTESSIDLVARGWRLDNYPATLSYSATPPDFGALVIQRRRWANGGLIILPKLVRHLWAGRRQLRPLEGVLRVHYLTSIAGTNVGLLLVLCYGFPGIEVSAWLPATAVGYFALQARDLGQLGYRRSDLVRIYALNLLLVPVNLGGVVKSLHQGLTGTKIPFGRTPKVRGRTAVPRTYLWGALVLLATWAASSAHGLAGGGSVRTAFAAVNVVLLIGAITRCIGWRALLADLRVLGDRPVVAPSGRARPPAAARRAEPDATPARATAG